MVGYGVCDNEDYFYDFIDDLYRGLGADVSAKDTVRVVQAKGSGYGISRCEKYSIGSCCVNSVWKAGSIRWSGAGRRS